MKTLLITILLLGCSGPAFTESNEEGSNQTDTAGGAGESPISGAGGSQGGSGGLGVAGTDSAAGNTSGGPSKAGSGGTSAMAGGPPMGEGGNSGEGGHLESAGTYSGPAQCLANHQTLECARVCDSSPYCQGILDCFVKTDSDLTSDCPGFSDTGYSLAAQAVRNCCHD